MSDWDERWVPNALHRETETPWQVTPEGEVVVGYPGELHMDMENRLGFGHGYTPVHEGVVSAEGEVDPFSTGGQMPFTPEHEHEIIRQFNEHKADPLGLNKKAEYQPLNDPSPFDFTKPTRPGYSFDNERPFVVHMADDDNGDEYPQALVGSLGSLHQDIYDEHDVGPIMLKGYVDHTGNTTVESGDEGYLPLVEKHMEHLKDIEDWPKDHTAALKDGNWGYLNGEVGFGQFHHQIIDALAQRQKMPDMEKGLLVNLALANAHPGNIKHDVAWGQFHDNYPVFWRTNVDRNAIWDAVQNARHVVEPPEHVMAHSKEMSEIDYMEHRAMIGSGGQLVEVYPGGVHMDYDGQPVALPQPTTTQNSLGDREQKYYGANVEVEGKIIGSVSVEVESNTRRTGEGWHEVVLHDAWVDPKFRGSDVWMKLYRWLRQHWPNDRIFGEMGQNGSGHGNSDMGEFFKRDNRRHYLGDDDAWEDTAIGQGTDGGIQSGGADQPNYGPASYSKTAAAVQYDPILPVPEGSLEKYGLEPVPGGRYINRDTHEEVTDQVRPGGMLQIINGKPEFHAQQGEAEPPGRAHGLLARVNLFRQRAGWRWNDPGQENVNTIISVEHGQKHYYALRTTFNGPLHLRTYPGASEPRLRPTTRGDLDLGTPVNTINLRGRQHPVYDHIEINPRRATERVGAPVEDYRKQYMGRAPWYIDTEGNPVVGTWGQFHHEIGALSKSPYQPEATYSVKGDVDKDGQVSVFNHLDREYTPEEQQQVMEHIHQPLRSAFGFGFHPELRPITEPMTDAYDFSSPPPAPPASPEAPVEAPGSLRARLKASTLGRLLGGSEGVTGLRGDYYLAGPREGEPRFDIENDTGMPKMMPDGQWASWSGWPDAYRFIYNGRDYMEQPEAPLESGHGYGHPGLKETWDEVWPDKKSPNTAYSGHAAGWHFPLVDGGRGILTYDNGHQNLGAMGDLISHVEAHHGGPARFTEGNEHLRPEVAVCQHPHGGMVQGPFPFDWEHYEQTGEMRRRPEFEQALAPKPDGDFDFSSPAPPPGTRR